MDETEFLDESNNINSSQVDDASEVGIAELRAGFVAIVGQPNVGKSTLMNQILGVKLAITSSKPQTTRNRILGVRTFSGRGQLAFIDTPGIHASSKRLNRALVRQAVDSLDEVDAVVHIVDARWCISSMDKEGHPFPGDEEMVLDILSKASAPTILVLNKIDLVSDKFKLLPVIEALQERTEYTEVIPVSALDGENTEALVELLLTRLPDGGLLFPEDMLTDQAERFIAAEYVREQVMLQTKKEIPYSVAVEVEKFEDVPRRNLLQISAVIHVERDSQKGIIIGAKGARIKQIGQAARTQLEQFFGKKVFLETFVRVQQGWSEDGRSLQRFGYE